MLSFNAINSSIGPEVTPFQGTEFGILNQGTGSETGEFDFTQYLLGLENPALDLILPDSSTGEAGIQQLDPGEEKDPLKDLLEKGNALWNPIFPNANPSASSVNAGNNTAIKDNAVNLLDRKSAGVKEDALLINKNSDETLVSKKENKEDSTLSFLKVHEELSKASLEEKPSKEVVIPKYAFHREVKSEKLDPKVQNSEEGINFRNLAQHQESEPAQSIQVSHQENIETLPAEEKKIIKEKKIFNDLNLQETGGRSHASEVAMNVVKVSQPTKRTEIPEVFKKVESMVHHGGGKMTVSLAPPELGKVEIEVITRGKNVEIKVQSENDLAKSTIEGKLSDLKHSMQLQDLNLSKVEVEIANPKAHLDSLTLSAGLHQFQMGREAHDQGFQRFSNSRENLSSQNQKSAKLNSHIPSIQSVSRVAGNGNGRVDIRI